MRRGGKVAKSCSDQFNRAPFEQRPDRAIPTHVLCPSFKHERFAAIAREMVEQRQSRQLAGHLFEKRLTREGSQAGNLAGRGRRRVLRNRVQPLQKAKSRA